MTIFQCAQERSFLKPGAIAPMKGFDANFYENLRKIGINLSIKKGEALDSSNIDRMMAAMDAIQPTVTTGTMATPIQFLQNWLPGFVFVMTAARKIDDLIGLSVMGEWEDEQVVQPVMERTGTSQPYGDKTNVPLSSWNVNFEKRTNVRFEEGMQVGREEEARAARMRVDTASMKRQAAALALEIIRNSVGFFGFNSGLNNTYGFLNDPGLPSYVTVAVGASSSTLWSTKTFGEIQKDILAAIVLLRTNSQDTIDPGNTPLTLALSTNARDRLATTTDFNISVATWLKETYPMIRVESAPQLNAANGGANVFYLFADRVQDDSTDGGNVFVQIVPSKFQLLGVQQKTKGYEEDYSNATCGVMVKRPWAVTRFSGI